MHFHDVAVEVCKELGEKGLQFVRVTDGGTGLSFELPRGWDLSLGPDGTCLRATHGAPPVGFLYLGRYGKSDADTDPWERFLDTNVARSPGQTIVVGETRALETDEPLLLVEFETEIDGEQHLGQGMRLEDSAGYLLAAYETSETLYHPGLVRRLLMAVLDSVAPEETDGSDRQADSILGIPVSAFWRVPSEPASISFGPEGSRFALKLPAGWQAFEVHEAGTVGWLLAPEGERPGDAGVPLITVSADDLVTDLETTLANALEALLDADVYTRGGAPMAVDVGGQSGVLQVYHGVPSGGTAGQVQGIWSLGLTDGTTVAHLFAAIPWVRMEALLDPLNAIARSLRVLPRRPNRELMDQFRGYWRCFDTHEEVAEVSERCYHFRADGTFAFVQRRVDRLEAIHHPPTPESLDLDGETGTWDIVGNTLSMLRHDGTREIVDIDGVSRRTAVVDHVLWERLEALATAPHRP